MNVMTSGVQYRFFFNLFWRLTSDHEFYLFWFSIIERVSISLLVLVHYGFTSSPIGCGVF